jgi:uncharacterized protein YndB with AHSA1/START domain
LRKNRKHNRDNETAEKTSLEIKRFINAPRARVYAAWTDPAQLREWFGPVWVRTCELVADPRVGGRFRWDVINRDGKEVTIQGEYREIVSGKRIVFTWKHCDDELWENRISMVTVDLSDLNDGTEVRLKHEELPGEESRDDHNRGWNSVLDRLEKFVNG